ncbi:MAG: hypothetical protein B7X12_06435 [Halothiobacillus sp. 20-53-49]|nr:MAG: hypothetical protein B7X12_06435 [Halothiobacillus sp. 20-53-49]HUN00984.1 hypothetical protein [Halothiobacillus sp.]
MPQPIPELGLCILSWRNHEKLRVTLDSYRRQGLFRFFSEARILFQEATAEDYVIAEEFDLSALGLESNVGIEQGWAYLLNHMNSRYIVFLENDCPLIEPEAVVAHELNQGVRLLDRGIVDVYRLRSKEHPGAKFQNCTKYQRYYPVANEPYSPSQSLMRTLRRWVRPKKAQRLIGSAPYCIHDATQRHPQLKQHTDDVIIVPSAYLNWTNQSVLFSRTWMQGVLLARVRSHPSHRSINGFQDIEMALNCDWWRQQAFKIGIGPGLFTHL